jgi:hypothetical protein
MRMIAVLRVAATAIPLLGIGMLVSVLFTPGNSGKGILPFKQKSFAKRERETSEQRAKRWSKFTTSNIKTLQ